MKKRKDEMDKLLEEMLQTFVEALKSNPDGLKFSVRTNDETPLMFVEIKKDENLKTYSPKTETTETDEAVIVIAELPGVNFDNLKLIMRGRTLKIFAKSKHKKFRKILYIPPDVDFSKSLSLLKNGILELILPKRQ